MSVQVGDSIPPVTLKHLGASGMEDISTGQLFGGKKTLLFGVPGAYTPSCSQKHLPGYVAHAEAFKAKGVDQIVCMAVNDPFVMKEWGKVNGADGKVFMLPDGNAEFTNALGLALDARGFGLGTRCQRFAMLVDDGVVKAIAVEEAPGGVTVSDAEAMLQKV